jgi:hypothetical protein
MPNPYLEGSRLCNATAAGNGITPDLAHATLAAASAAPHNTLRRVISTTALPQALIPAPQDAYTAMALTQQTITNTSSGQASQALAL